MDRRWTRDPRRLLMSIVSTYVLASLIPVALQYLDVRMDTPPLYVGWIAWFVSLFAVSGGVTTYFMRQSKAYRDLPWPLRLFYRFVLWLFFFVVLLVPGSWLWNYLHPV